MFTTLRSILPLLLGASLFTVGSGLVNTLLPLRLLALGYGTESIGMVVTASGVGFLLGCLFSPRLIRSVGHVRAYAAFAALEVIAALSLEWATPLPALMALRVVAGLASAGLFVVVEAWLNEQADSEYRGRILTAYVLITSLAYGLGQLLAHELDPAESRFLMLTAALYVSAVIPVTAIKSESPRQPHDVRLAIWHAFKVSPVGAAGCFATGLISSTFGGLGPVYGQAIGLTQGTLVLLLATMQIGGLALQFPLGLLSDKLDRRFVLLGILVSLIAVAGGFIAIDGRTPLWILFLLFGCLGGLAETLYPVSLAHANDRAKPDEYVSVSGNLLLVWAFGGTLGPIIGASAMEHAGPSAFFVYVIIIAGLLALFTLWRIARRGRLVDSTLEEFVAYPTLSPTVYEWVPHRPLKIDGVQLPPTINKSVS